MKKNRGFVGGMLVMALTFAVIFTGCDDGSTDGGGAKGVLTITGAPASGTVVICDAPEPTTQQGLVGLVASPIAQCLQGDSATTYKLTKSTGAFDSTGEYLVIYTHSGGNYYKKASFTNGSATINYSEMKAAASLPLI